MRLEARQLACNRGGRQVFRDLSFALGSGEAMAVTGPNGAGKSSLLRVVAGLLHPEAGHLELSGGDAELSLGEQAHYVGHQDAVKPALTVGENLRFWTDLLGSPASKEALAGLGLDRLSDLPAAYLSAGQRRRLCLARLIAVERPIWLLDEPTSSLDAGAQVLLAELVRSHLARGGLVLVATHGSIGVEAAKELELGAAA